MKAIFAISLLILFSAVLSQQNKTHNFEEIKKCVYKHTAGQLYSLISEVATNKLSVQNFLDAYYNAAVNEMLKIVVDDCGFEDLFKSLYGENDGHFLGKAGLTVIYGTNCSKDVGFALWTLDTFVTLAKEHKQIGPIIIQGALFAFSAYQGGKDCYNAYKNILDVWRQA